MTLEAHALEITAIGFVPALQLEYGRVLTEDPEILQFLADRDLEQRLTAPLGSFERAQMLE